MKDIENKELNVSENTDDQKKEIKIPVKFNKEVKEISLQEASNLAQKGMKFDIISEDYEKLKNLALSENKSVSEFLGELISNKKNERIENLTKILGGNKDMAEHVISLEDKETNINSDLDEVKKYFPKIKGDEDLPGEVVEASKLKGTNLLNEYLRYLLKERLNLDKVIDNQNKTQGLSLGSHINSQTEENPETIQFLKGLWR